MNTYRSLAFGLVLFLTLLICNACSTQRQDSNIRVAVAANFYPLMLELKNDFETQHGVQVDLVSGASGVLSSQIRQGAPYDAFFSADLGFSEGLFIDGFAKSKPLVYAKGSLVLCSNRGLGALKNLCSLRPDQKIGIANPKTAPYGKAALAFLQKQDCYPTLENQLVFANNINQLDQYISNGVVALGITAASSVLKKSFMNRYEAIPYTQGLEQSCVLLDGRGATHPLTQKFIDYILSDDIQKTIVSKGYRL